MNPELAHEIGVETAKMYRAVGITMLLGPQMDIITSPIWGRGNGAYTEDPALSADIANAFISGLQSTFDEDGNDLGWGDESVIAIAKHFVGAGASEGGRNDHDWDGKYTVYPGENFDAHLVPFVDGAFNLEGKTESVGGVMMNYAIAYSEDEEYGELVGGAYSEYKLDKLKKYGYDGFIMTDWGVVEIVDDWGVTWGVEDWTTPERFARLFELGIDQVGGTTSIDEALEGYKLLEEKMGEEEALEQIRSAAYQFILQKMNVGLFDNPYISTEKAVSSIWTKETKEFGDMTQQQAVIMLKNNGNTIKPYDENAEKLTAYIPYTVSVDGGIWSGYTYSCIPSVDLEAAAMYYNVVTDQVGEPTGTDENGNVIYTTNDIIRASADEIAKCDIAIVKMDSPYTASTYVADEDMWLPASLQYEEYTADSDAVREESISGETKTKEINSVYGKVVQNIKENRSYYGNTASRPRTYLSYETFDYVTNAVPEDCKVIVAMGMSQEAMVWSEIEPKADVILARYKDGALFLGDSKENVDVMLRVIAGEVEPSALLPIQQPASMEAVEAQLEDVPRDVECYVDADGNTYDFAYGLNWSGVINDERVAKYNVPALTEPETQPVK